MILIKKQPERASFKKNGKLFVSILDNKLPFEKTNKLLKQHLILT
jgi:hypothetical protein